MADEGNNPEIQSYRSAQSVEIEMANHDDEITEYEMADEQEYNDAEVVDIDLVDVSRQASPAHSRHMKEPEAELVEWAGAGHGLYVQCRDQFNALLERVVKEGRERLANAGQ